MNRSVLTNRILFALLVLGCSLTFFATGGLFAALIGASDASPWQWAGFAGVVVLLLGVMRSFVLAQLPIMLRLAHWQLHRPIVIWELALAGALAAGAWANPGLTTCWPLFIVSAPTACLVAALGSRGFVNPLAEPAEKFFLFTRGNVNDWSLRRLMAVAAGLGWGLGGGLAAISRSTSLGDALQAFAIGFAIALSINLLQMNPIRIVGLVPFAFLFLPIAAACHLFAPNSSWPASIFGVAAGLAIPALSVGSLLLSPPRHRFAVMLLNHLVALLVAALGIMRFVENSRWGWLLAVYTLILAVLFVKLFFREFVEQIMELVYWPMYRFEVRGPGRIECPTRGPTLIIANHAAFFDPLYLCKVLPLSRLRAMMTSTMFDRPFLKWLAGDVYGAIRVPDGTGFRRTAPELDEAVAALKRGEQVMIFPEAWLRRKEEQPIRRFAQGVYRILKEAPDTVVVPCWIESWGSYLSYKNGPPAKNKPFDWFYKIRIAAGAPLVVPPELFADQHAVRRYLLERVNESRLHLGLPLLELPAYSAKDEVAEEQTSEPRT